MTGVAGGGLDAGAAGGSARDGASITGREGGSTRVGASITGRGGVDGGSIDRGDGCTKPALPPAAGTGRALSTGPLDRAEPRPSGES